MRVRVSVSSVDEGVFERAADVLGGQTGHRRHHVTRKLADTQRPPVLTSPPVVLRPEDTQNQGICVHIFYCQISDLIRTGRMAPVT